MITLILTLLHGISPEWTTIIISAVPFVEVRLSIPVAIEVFKLPVSQVVILAWIGSAIPGILLPTLLERLEIPCRKHIPYCDRLFDWMVERVQKKYNVNYQEKGAFGLMLFVAIPLPVTGVWTGALAAWVFRIKKSTAIPAILLGTAVATILVTAITLGAFGAVRSIF